MKITQMGGEKAPSIKQTLFRGVNDENSTLSKKAGGENVK